MIRNFLAADDAVLRLIQFHIDHVIRPLLPIAGTGRAGSAAGRIGRGPDAIELLEGILRRGGDGKSEGNEK